ncbi:hypothetical protein QQ008_18595 [Fulvivirgaceae bacterium BMA10]|uniref:Uncharacterized protein n=1 Tax=Splendidivirga corallicola TaxID=3051826 RepID=A0ABT8KUV0_9BACT|nr:hypothetical protein [Fulvivirgaceae bacterium BMA10]
MFSSARPTSKNQAQSNVFFGFIRFVFLFLGLTLSSLTRSCPQESNGNLNEGIYGIKNSYAVELQEWTDHINKTKELIGNMAMDVEKQKKMKGVLKQMLAKRDDLLRNYNRTQEIILTLKLIDPVLFNEIDQIKDKEGSRVAVYVKAIDKFGEKNGIYATTNLDQCKGNENIYTSPYGDRTVSVTVNSGQEAVLLLAHEFGHVKYQVPNLAFYYKYFKETYLKDGFNPAVPGHFSKDPSRLSVKKTLTRFKRLYRQYKQDTKHTDEIFVSH